MYSFRTEIEKEYTIELVALSGEYEINFFILFDNSSDPVEWKNMNQEVYLNIYRFKH